ncbi:MAG TPA: hypothetical protein VML19_14320, partial [Verrucomicrobiae bacterium]|nr:hypothetical protein [Verrucomicrobiae bacterium]
METVRIARFWFEDSLQEKGVMRMRPGDSHGFEFPRPQSTIWVAEWARINCGSSNCGQGRHLLHPTTEYTGGLPDFRHLG